MTTGEYTPLLRNGSSRINTTQHHLPIQAHYFDITDIESWPIAGLVVLLDGQSMPVRAELHLYDSLEPHVQEAAIRQARLVLQERYIGGVPVPVRILETFPAREEMSVRLPPLGARPTSHSRFTMPTRPQLLIGAAAVVLLALVWFGFWLGGRGSGLQEGVEASTTPDAVQQAALQTDAANGVEAAGEEGASEAVGEAVPTAGNTNLPVSRNARSDLGIGVRVQVIPGLRVALRSEPGIDRGIIIGELADDDVATIVSGPQYAQGDTDTIVWWYITLSNGTQAWVAANTSQQTLLMPAQ